MKTGDFFDFHSQLLSTTIQAHAVGLKTAANGADARWNLIKGVYKDIDFPVIFKQKYGKNLTDILDTGWPSLYLVSDRLKDILEKDLLTGWKTFPIKLYDKKGKEIPSYHGFSILGHCGPTNYDRSEIIEKRKVPNGPLSQYYKGVSFDMWDGSDFFTPDQTYQIFITKKAFKILKKHKMTNLQTNDLSEKETPVAHVQNKSTNQ